MTNPTEAPMANAIDDVKPWPFKGHAPGNYTCLCHLCGKIYEGDKSSVRCLVCAVMAAKAERTAPSQHTGWSDEAVEAAIKAFHDNREGHDQWAGKMSMRAALSAAFSIAPATGLEVKALEWVKSNASERWTAQYAFGQFEITLVLYEREDGCQYSWLRGICSEYFDTLEAAMSRVQAHFDAAVRSSISLSVAKESGEAHDYKADATEAMAMYNAEVEASAKLEGNLIRLSDSDRQLLRMIVPSIDQRSREPNDAWNQAAAILWLLIDTTDPVAAFGGKS